MAPARTSKPQAPSSLTNLNICMHACRPLLSRRRFWPTQQQRWRADVAAFRERGRRGHAAGHAPHRWPSPPVDQGHCGASQLVLRRRPERHHRRARAHHRVTRVLEHLDARTHCAAPARRGAATGRKAM
eukprot:5086782-Pleurochrysis_carterae.AAC.2